MKKKIIMMVVCVVLFLVFVSLSYGGPDPKYDRLRGRPEQELLSPPRGDQFDDVLLVVLPSWSSFCVVVCIKKDSSKENATPRSVITRETTSKMNIVKTER